MEGNSASQEATMERDKVLVRRPHWWGPVRVRPGGVRSSCAPSSPPPAKSPPLQGLRGVWITLSPP